MKNGAILLLASLLLFTAAFAENATSLTYEQDGFFVQRILQSDAQSKISYTTDTAITTYVSVVKIYLKNTGASARDGIVINEDLTYLPSGAKIEFLQKPSSVDGRTATWDVGSLDGGADYSVSYRVPVEINDAAFKLLPSPQITARVADVSIDVPSSVQKGDTVGIVLTSGGRPVAGAKVTVSGPSGASTTVQTGADGRAEFKADETGFYTYSVSGYNLLTIAATESVTPKDAAAPAAGAAIPPKPLGFLDMISGLLPYVAGIVLIVAIALMVFNYVQATSESRPAAPQPQQPSSNQGTSQTFSYSYSPPVSQAKAEPAPSGTQQPSAQQTQEDAARRREATRALLEKRRPEMKPEQEADEEEAGEEAVEFAPSKSRSEDIERTIKELEALKAKLKKKKAKSGRK